MKVAIVGSRGVTVDDLARFIPDKTDEIVSGGAEGVDRCARNYAVEHGIKLTEFLPDYKMFGDLAPIARNDAIVDYSDEVIAFWDGKSHGTLYVINRCRATDKKVTVIKM